MKSKRKNNMKKLKLRIVKFDRLLVVEQLEKRGKFKNTDHVKVDDDLWLLLESINLKKDKSNGRSADYYADFVTNVERDEYTANLIKWITEEQFGDAGELEVGKECLVSDDGKSWEIQIFAGTISKYSSEEAFFTEEKIFLTTNPADDNCLWRWKYAEPISDRLKINGEIYTWERNNHE